MIDDRFPSWVPKLGDLVRVTPSTVDYVTRHYKTFCEEAYVVSRFQAISYEGTPIIEVTLGGRMITEPLRFGPTNDMCLVHFDGEDRLVNVQIVLE